MSGLELLAGLGTVISGAGAIAGGIAQKNASDFQAEQLQQQAQAERAKASRETEQQHKQADLMMSRQQALASTSGAGAGADAPSIVKIMSDTAGQGAYNAGMATWNGEERARGLEAQASAARMSGNASLLGGALGGVSGVFNGFSKNPWFSQYGS